MSNTTEAKVLLFMALLELESASDKSDANNSEEIQKARRLVSQSIKALETR